MANTTMEIFVKVLKN